MSACMCVPAWRTHTVHPLRARQPGARTTSAPEEGHTPRTQRALTGGWRADGSVCAPAPLYTRVLQCFQSPVRACTRDADVCRANMAQMRRVSPCARGETLAPAQLPLRAAHPRARAPHALHPPTAAVRETCVCTSPGGAAGRGTSLQRPSQPLLVATSLRAGATPLSPASPATRPVSTPQAQPARTA